MKTTPRRLFVAALALLIMGLATWVYLDVHQPTSGANWRLLAVVVEAPWGDTIEIAEGPDDLDDLPGTDHIDDADFDNNAIVLFRFTGSSGGRACNSPRLSDVTISDRDAEIVIHIRSAHQGFFSSSVCASNELPPTLFVIAIPYDALPLDQYRVTYFPGGPGELLQVP